MNFTRFPRTKMFDFRREEGGETPNDPTSTNSNYEDPVTEESEETQFSGQSSQPNLPPGAAQAQNQGQGQGEGTIGPNSWNTRKRRTGSNSWRNIPRPGLGPTPTLGVNNPSNPGGALQNQNGTGGGSGGGVGGMMKFSIFDTQNGMTSPGVPSGLPAQRRDPVEDAAVQQPTDSLTLGQLKAATAAQPKQKTQLFTYRYDDTDTLMSELEEFYSYNEMPHVVEGPQRFEGSFEGSWTEAPLDKRKQYMEVQLEYMESPVHTVRREAQGRLLYLLQGCFAETTSPEMQLHWVIENAKTLRSVDGVSALVTALQNANRNFFLKPSGSEKPNSGPTHAPLHPIDPSDERSAELRDLLGMLYFTVEVFRTDETFGDELMASTNPLPLVLFGMVSTLKDRLPKGYPVKKILLLLWKTLLAVLGGMKEVNGAKALSRELAVLPPQEKGFTKASPIDITNWRRDINIKYPTYNPQSNSSLPNNEKLAESIRPIPPRPNYHSTDLPIYEPDPSPMPLPPPTPLPQIMANAATPVSPLVPGQKTKKQQFQTDPNRPFIFPFSSSSTSQNGSLVPYAIAEADKLFAKHQYVSLGLFQMWEARDECMREERGLGKNGLIGFENHRYDDDDDDDLEDLERSRLEWRFEEEEMDCQARGDREGQKKAREKLIAARRLARVDLIYRKTLPILQSCVIVLLKLLLQTVTGPDASHMTSQQGEAVPPGYQSPTHDAQQTGPPKSIRKSTTEIDSARHREITSKAVSAILILLLKWFKASHILKFHYLAQLLFDSNCLLLVLKMFGLADVYMTVQTKSEVEDLNFFRYCQLKCSKSPPRPEDDMFLSKDQSSKTSPKTGSQEDDNGDIELINDYSWRNFFASINFVKILQKMTKHQSHRTYMLHQYKSSQILKRMLRANQPMLQLQVLKLIKSQMPWCGRKWRQGNMKVITSIYLNCRPDFRDEWLGGTDQDTELDDSLPQEAALRSLVAFYNKHEYPSHLVGGHRSGSPEPHHQRSNSTSAVMIEDPGLRSHGGGFRSESSSLSDTDIFPPRKTQRSSSSSTSSSFGGPDNVVEFWLNEYEDILSEIFGDGEVSPTQGNFNLYNLHSSLPHLDNSVGSEHLNSDLQNGDIGRGGGLVIRGAPGAAEIGDSAWVKLGEMMRGDNDDTMSEISDSESIVSVGELGDEARVGIGLPGSDGEKGDIVGIFARQQEEPATAGKNTWEHMSPTTLSRLPPSPHERRRSSTSKRRNSSTSSPLRPVIPREKRSSISTSPHNSTSSSPSASSPRTHSFSPNSASRLSPHTHSHLSPNSQQRFSPTSGKANSPRDGRGENDDPFDEVMIEDDEDDDGDDEDEEEEELRGPMPINKKTEDEERRNFAAVDEVELVYGE